MRVGDEVKLNWTTPTQTTDKLPIKGPMTAEICREAVAAAPAKSSTKTPCAAVTREQVTAGASDAVDSLPATLTAGPPRMLSYRVQLLNAAGRTAGPSPAAFAVAGETLGPIQGFVGSVIKGGVLLRWAEAQGPKDTEQQAPDMGKVELDRVTLDPHVATSPERKGGLPGATKQATEVRLKAGAGAVDPRGTIDRTVEIGHSYRYTAQRVDSVEVGGQTLELRSVPSEALSFTVRDQFPPDVPAGLVAVPGSDGEPGSQLQTPTIDLSWEPDIEARVAGYRVYRREVVANNSGAWARLGAELVTSSAYRDLAVVAGHRYAYRVTAVSTAGNESTPSAEAAETAPTR